MEGTGLSSSPSSSVSSSPSSSSSTSPSLPNDTHRRRRYDLMRVGLGLMHGPGHALLDFLGSFRLSTLDSGARRSNSIATSDLNSSNSRGGSGNTDTDVSEVSIRITSTGEIRSASQIRDAHIPPPSALPPAVPASEDGNADAGTQRYDFQQLARWIEQVLPFSLLLLMVFIRQHLQGFLVTLWISAVMIKSNDVLRKQTALKGERRSFILLTIGMGLLLQIAFVYWWFYKEDLFRPLLLLPPQKIPKFWHAIFMIIVNDTMVRQGAMVLKCGLLIYYKNTRGRCYRRQGQLLTFVEYLVLLYRALLPAPVWYRFFLNKDYGSLFSSLTTGLYLTFKLTSVLEKLQTFIAALKALFHREVQYGCYATTEEIAAAGDLCAICQEKMHAPILLSCKHIFCEDCVSEWFGRERTCPLCRAVVKPAELRSFGDGSTSLFYQVF